MASKQELQAVRDAILDLYLDVKVRSNDEVSSVVSQCSLMFDVQLNGLDEHKLAEERRKLHSVDPKVIVDYIRTSIEILLNLKMEDNPQKNGGDPGSSSPPPNISITSS